MVGRIATVALASALALLCGCATAAEDVATVTSAASSVVNDPAGDSLSAAPYMDVVHAQVTEQQGKGTLFFKMNLAGEIPDAPSEADLIWVWHVDTDPTSSPGGLYVDYIVRVRWFEGAFVGQVVNRAPISTGGAPIVTNVPFRIDGKTVKVFVDLATLGGPASFGWNAATRPGATVPYADFAPDAPELLTWSN
jgi:hypothetical protein